jgi:MFS-type transporter involved in bile tolerance (Atg22 family)
MVNENKTPGINHLTNLFTNQVLAVTGQVGCLTLVIILAAVFGGLWLDSRFDTKPIITIILVIGSVPVTMYMLIQLVRRTTLGESPQPNTDQPLAEEENKGGR